MPKWQSAPDQATCILSNTEENTALKEACQALSRGQLVAFPTETVYGLGADASNADALKKLFQTKGRPSTHPVIVHLSDGEDAKKWCAEFPESAVILSKVFWPGPLTLVLKKARHVLDLVTGGQDTVALRVPSHPLAQSLLQEFGSGIAAPSANKFGRLSPTSAEDVRNEFGDEIAMVLDGGQCEVGIESTIVDLTGEEPRILRPGMIQAESIFVALSGLELPAQRTNAAKPRVPGDLPSHYAPNTPLQLVSSDNLLAQVESMEREGRDTAVLSFRNAPVLHRHWISASRYPSHYAHMLYRYLRKLDLLGAELIIVEEPPEGAEWEGVRDRLQRAAGSSSNEEECDGS